LPVENLPIGHDNYAIEYLLVASAVKACKPVGEPRNAVCLATPRRVLNQVVSSRPFALCRRYELADGIELMVARKDHRLSRDPPVSAAAIFDLFIFLFEEHEVAENV
jgi:hypothetical protein